MKRFLACFLFALLAGFSLAPGAEEAGEKAQVPSALDRLDAWLRIEEANRRCASLYTFESREIERRVKAALDLTQPAQIAKAAAGSAGFEAKLKVMEDLLARRRAAMREAVAGETCEALAAGPMLEGRRVYMRNFLQLVLVADSYGEDALKPAHETRGFQLLGNIIRQLYGDSLDALAQELVADLNKHPPPQGRAWEMLEPTLRDLTWQARLNEAGFVMQPHREKVGWMALFEAGEPHPRWGAFARARELWIDDGEGNRIPYLWAQGQTRDGRIAFVVAAPEAPAEGDAVDMKLAALSQDEPGTGVWSDTDWRTGATLFEAARESGEDCPGDVCFVLPHDLSNLITVRQASGEGFYYYEVFTARADDFPPPDISWTHDRERLFPPRFADN